MFLPDPHILHVVVVVCTVVKLGWRRVIVVGAWMFRAWILGACCALGKWGLVVRGRGMVH